MYYTDQNRLVGFPPKVVSHRDLLTSVVSTKLISSLFLELIEQGIVQKNQFSSAITTLVVVVVVE